MRHSFVVTKFSEKILVPFAGDLLRQDWGVTQQPYPVFATGCPTETGGFSHYAQRLLFIFYQPK